jgi:hypothetical protein
MEDIEKYKKIRLSGKDPAEDSGVNLANGFIDTPKSACQLIPQLFYHHHPGFLGQLPCSFTRTMWERSSAVKGLPGPEYGILGLVKALLSKQPHRWTTIWADQYGPIVRLRVLCFHVSLDCFPLPLLPALVYSWQVHTGDS